MSERDTDIEMLFDAARAEKQLTSTTLFDRVVNDAETIQTQFLRQADDGPASTASRTPVWKFLGGWVTAISFATCTAAGVYLGYVAPDYLSLFSPTASSMTDLVLQDFATMTEGL
ncbi:MAG: hypothetical protein AAFR98_08105 [Pseudomonadota bacterium]